MGDNPLVALLRVFLPLSFAAIGGGSSILAEIERQSVDVHHWLTQAQFLDAFAISRAAPGPGSLLVTIIGFKVAGIAGALVASFAIFVPSSVLVGALARFWRRHREARWQRAVERGLAPIAAGLALAGGLAVLRTAEGGATAWIVAIGALAALRWTRVSPLALLVAGGAVFLVAAAVGAPS